MRALFFIAVVVENSVINKMMRLRRTSLLFDSLHPNYTLCARLKSFENLSVCVCVVIFFSMFYFGALLAEVSFHISQLIYERTFLCLSVSFYLGQWTKAAFFCVHLLFRVLYTVYRQLPYCLCYIFSGERKKKTTTTEKQTFLVSRDLCVIMSDWQQPLKGVNVHVPTHIW